MGCDVARDRAAVYVAIMDTPSATIGIYETDAARVIRVLRLAAGPSYTVRRCAAGQPAKSGARRTSWYQGTRTSAANAIPPVRTHAKRQGARAGAGWKRMSSMTSTGASSATTSAGHGEHWPMVKPRQAQNQAPPVGQPATGIKTARKGSSWRRESRMARQRHRQQARRRRRCYRRCPSPQSHGSWASSASCAASTPSQPRMVSASVGTAPTT